MLPPDRGFASTQRDPLAVCTKSGEQGLPIVDESAGHNGHSIWGFKALIREAIIGSHFPAISQGKLQFPFLYLNIHF
jgi:hypothetical protein